MEADPADALTAHSVSGFTDAAQPPPGLVRENEGGQTAADAGDEEAAQRWTSLSAISAPPLASLPPPTTFPAIDRAFALLARRLHRPFHPFHATQVSASPSLLQPSASAQPAPAAAATASPGWRPSGSTWSAQKPALLLSLWPHQEPPTATEDSATTGAVQLGVRWEEGDYAVAEEVADASDGCERQRMEEEAAEKWRAQLLVTPRRSPTLRTALLFHAPTFAVLTCPSLSAVSD